MDWITIILGIAGAVTILGMGSVVLAMMAIK